MDEYSEDEVRARFEDAVKAVCEKDRYLFDVDANERSISHRLAVHLESKFPGYDVDCEYNRDGFDVKRLALEERNTSDTDLDAVTVFPDIIIHKRGDNNSNLLVIEMKKASSSIGSEYDIKKLRAFRHGLAYKYVAHCTIGYTRDGDLAQKIIWGVTD